MDVKTLKSENTIYMYKGKRAPRYGVKMIFVTA